MLHAKIYSPWPSFRSSSYKSRRSRRESRTSQKFLKARETRRITTDTLLCGNAHVRSTLRRSSIESLSRITIINVNVYISNIFKKYLSSHILHKDVSLRKNIYFVCANCKSDLTSVVYLCDSINGNHRHVFMH